MSAKFFNCWLPDILRQGPSLNLALANWVASKLQGVPASILPHPRHTLHVAYFLKIYLFLLYAYECFACMCICVQ